MRVELPPDAVEHVARQVGIAVSELGFYDFASRAPKRHRSELRELTGWHECTKTEPVKRVSHLVDVIWHDERREERHLPQQRRGARYRRPTSSSTRTALVTLPTVASANTNESGGGPPRCGTAAHPLVPALVSSIEFR
ncbi:hypothetical protein ACIA98_34655 [Streptomyces sp. NPDC051366]|uniref:hypothetical protein n=1 Tax=Streptomyces sp. NPDC051366 TaxID=3365652 RepID=UPI00378FE449